MIEPIRHYGSKGGMPSLTSRYCTSNDYYQKRESGIEFIDAESSILTLASRICEIASSDEGRRHELVAYIHGQYISFTFKFDKAKELYAASERLIELERFEAIVNVYLLSFLYNTILQVYGDSEITSIFYDLAVQFNDAMTKRFNMPSWYSV